jgi:hypothetical protein
LLIFRPFNFIILYFNFKLHFFKFESLNFDREERKLSGNEKGERKWLIDYIPTPKNMELGFIGFFFQEEYYYGSFEFLSCHCKHIEA